MRPRGWTTTRQLLMGATVTGVVLSGFAAYVGASVRAERWQEIAWPFPRDGWPPGRAYSCSARFCGGEMELYVRPKIGFCNCNSGVADDEEVDRVADLDLISERFRPLEPGRVVRIADMPGRMRSYDLQMPDRSQRQAVGMAVSRRCDLMVAVVQGKAAADALQRMALDFLSSSSTMRWMKSAMHDG
ncbi:MAG: hypothetical protein JWR49_179 [Tardiphaga sp.]|jgi:hypothetical protein|nr:hypothetical protein [Tardiphaga sp.]